MTPIHSLQQLDARVKILFTLAFILFLNLTPTGAWGAYILFLSLILSAAILFQADWKLLMRRSLLSLFFITAAIPLLFTDPAPMFPLHISARLTVWVSQPGLQHFASITIKAWVSMLAAMLLTSVTPVPALLLAFQRLHIPQVFIGILSLMWRYLFVIREEALSLMHARESRSAAAADPAMRSGGNLVWRARVTGGMAGSLLLRSLERADRVYAAMLSRGYNGTMPDTEKHPLSRSEWLLLAAGLVLLLFFLLYSLLTGTPS